MDEKILDIRFTSVGLNSGWREPFAPQGRNPNINSKPSPLQQMAPFLASAGTRDGKNSNKLEHIC
jgi:hypothetical protein